MMSQHAALTSLFGDDPFFRPEQMLWPLRHEALSPLSSLQQDFFNRRTKLADSLLRELHDGPDFLGLCRLPFTSHSLARLGETEQRRETSSSELQKENKDDLLVTLDARGYSPNDITVKLEGRSLAVVAMKQAGAEETQSHSSSSSCAAFCSSASSKMGFAQKIDLPAHVDLSGLSCSLMDDGQLRIHAPAAAKPQICEESQVPIRFRTSLEFPITKDKTEENTD
ncbi:heat shock protein beta-9 [Halichoeres trimaculatus]|uniref:heat shock protein beta-9 n=1 Tax=Halichoeres trimaculatus TaxID=147232 RepID=UPI003D9F7920